MKNKSKERITILEGYLDSLYCRQEYEDDGNNKCDYCCETCPYNYHDGSYDSDNCHLIAEIKLWLDELKKEEETHERQARR